MGPFVLAWLTGESILVYRWAKAKAPPTPGALMLSSGLYALLALLAQAQQARTFATTLAWGYNLAILLQVAGQGKVPVKTGWPPAVITDQNVIMPTGNSHSGGDSGNPANPKGAPGSPGGPAAPVNPGTPPTGPGTIYPPGSQNL